jgi:hypothetical protein
VIISRRPSFAKCEIDVLTLPIEEIDELSLPEPSLSILLLEWTHCPPQDGIFHQYREYKPKNIQI